MHTRGHPRYFCFPPAQLTGLIERSRAVQRRYGLVELVTVRFYQQLDRPKLVFEQVAIIMGGAPLPANAVNLPTDSRRELWPFSQRCTVLRLVMQVTIAVRFFSSVNTCSQNLAPSWPSPPTGPRCRVPR
jgi:hypothetical protein